MMQFWFRMLLVLVVCSVTSVPLKIVLEPSSAIVAQNVTLNCDFEQHYYSENDEILWEFSTLGKPITVWQSFPGTKELRKQAQRFHNRTHVKFRHEKASLTLQNISLSDSGDYRCIIIKKGKSEQSSSEFVNLIVSAPYEISQLDSHYQNGSTVLQCVALGGFPLGELKWHYENKEPMSQPWHVLNSSSTDGTFVINSTLKLEWLQNTTICCSIIHPLLKQETTCKEISDHQEDYGSHLQTALMGVGIFIAIAIVIISIIYWEKKRRKKTRQMGITNNSELVQALNVEDGTGL